VQVWLSVLAWTGGADVVRFGMTCHAASLLAADASLWRAMCLGQRRSRPFLPVQHCPNHRQVGLSSAL
jgi:hypothetical protein